MKTFETTYRIRIKDRADNMESEFLFSSDNPEIAYLACMGKAMLSDWTFDDTLAVFELWNPLANRWESVPSWREENEECALLPPCSHCYSSSHGILECPFHEDGPLE